MDSEHRHELKENDLQEFLENFGDFWKKYGNVILTVLAVVVIIYAGQRLWRDRAESARENAWTELAGATAPQAAERIAVDYSNPTVQAIAYLKAGDLYLAKGSMPDTASARAETLEGENPYEQQREQALQSAEGRYQQVQQLKVPKVYHLNAMLGLAAVAENRRNWQQAEQWYDQVLAAAGDQYVTLAELARAKKALLPQLQQKVVFAPDQEPGLAEGSQGQRPRTQGAQSSQQGSPASGSPSSIGSIFSAKPGQTMDLIHSGGDQDTSNGNNQTNDNALPPLQTLPSDTDDQNP